MHRVEADKENKVIHTQYEQFYQAYYGLVLGYLRNKVQSVSDAEDITSKVFLYCFEKWNTYDPSKASQITWLFMIVRSRWVDFLRTNRSYVDIDELDEVLTNGNDELDNAVRIQAIRQELAASLEKLHENQRTAIIMRYFGDYKDSEIARYLNITEGNVRVIIHRGVSRLKTELSLKELLV